MNNRPPSVRLDRDWKHSLQSRDSRTRQESGSSEGCSGRERYAEAGSRTSAFTQDRRTRSSRRVSVCVESLQISVAAHRSGVTKKWVEARSRVSAYSDPSVLISKQEAEKRFEN